MAYQIKCDDYILLDLRDEQLIVKSPKCKVGVNKVGEASFTIYQKHPFFDKLQLMKSIFEISDEYGVVFRGRMTNDTIDLKNAKAVDLEGLMAFFNDSVVKPFNFPDDFIDDENYIEASENGNVVEFFLNWLIENHNSQVQDFQKFKLGDVTVKDINNYITRSESKYANTWETLKSKLFDSALGGNLCIRYEADGNYIDYLEKFELTNTQDIVYGENLVDLKRDVDSSTTYSAIMPFGAEIETKVEVVNEETGETTTETKKEILTLESIADGNINDDIVKITLPQGHFLYSKSAIENYGWIVAPTDDTTWSDVTEPQNLLTKSTTFLLNDGVMLSETTEFKSVDLHFTDAEIRSFRIYRKQRAYSKPHNLSGIYDLTELDIDILNPQNTLITVGNSRRTLTSLNAQQQSSNTQRIENVEKDISENRTQLSEIQNQVFTQSTSIINDAEAIMMKALEEYVKTSNLEEFRSTVSSELLLLKNQLTLKFEELTSNIQNVDGDLQEKFNQIATIFTFNINGFTIGKSSSPYKIFMDDNEISMFVGEIRVLWFEITEDGQIANIPELKVSKLFDLLGLIFEEDETHINADYIGGEV